MALFFAHEYYYTSERVPIIICGKRQVNSRNKTCYRIIKTPTDEQQTLYSSYDPAKYLIMYTAVSRVGALVKMTGVNRSLCRYRVPNDFVLSYYRFNADSPYDYNNYNKNVYDYNIIMVIS